MKLGLIGKSLVHSFSSTYFNEKFLKENLESYAYHNYEIEELNEATLHDLIIKEKLSGFNVTIPYKEKVLPYLHTMSDDAMQIGAVNTVDVNWIDDKTYTLKGFNTDWTGFLKSIRPFLTTHHQKALILGTGGAAKAIAYALKSLGIEFYFVSSKDTHQATNTIKYSELNQFVIQHFKLIVNTSPLGTFPQIDTFPAIPYEYIGYNHLLCDLVYNPSITKFMEKGKEQGATVLNGLGMLQFQADEAWAIWRNKKGHSV
jgi:shikimate dehydrogenase